MGIKVQHTPIQAVGSGARLAGQAQALKRKQDKAQQAALQARQLAAAADRQKSQLIAAAQRQRLQIAASAAIEEMRTEARKDYTPGKRPEKPGDKTPSSWKYDSDDPFSPTHQQPWEDDMGAYITPEVYKALQEKTVGAASQERQGVMQQEKSFELPHYQEQYGALQGNLYEQMEIDLDALYASYFSDEGKFISAKARLEASYQQKDLKGYKEIKAEEQEELRVQAIRSRRRAGKEEMTPAQEIATRLQLGQEAEGLAFPREEENKPFSFREIASLETFIYNTANEAKRFYWHSSESSKEIKKQEKNNLMAKYIDTVNLLQVQDYNPARREQFNDLWNRVMASDKRFKDLWFTEKGNSPPQMRAIFAKGRISNVMKERLVGKTPLAASLIKEKKPLVEKIYGTGAEMRERYGLEQRPKGPLQVRTQAEYDQIPSGTQYIGTDGQIRIKK